MPAVRIIPRLDIKGPNTVKGIHAEGLRIVGSPRELARRYFAEGADEIIYMDIVASLYQRSIDFDLLRSVADEIFVPLTVGGGLRSVHDIANALRSGADKVAVNTYAVRQTEFLAEAVHHFGSQCIVLSVEAKRVRPGKWEAYTDGGREHSGLDAVDWIKRALALGIGEILLTSVDRDGTRQGYDLDLVKAVTAFAGVPVIAHGGAGSSWSVVEVTNDGHADAAAVSTLFHYNDFTVDGLKRDLAREGIKVRL